MTPTLPPAFLLLADAALVSGGHDPSTPQRLQRIAGFVADALTLDNLIHRTTELTSAADVYMRAVRGRGVTEKNFPIVADAVEVGLVAGFLIARMLACETSDTPAPRQDDSCQPS